jgi:hypothetical protein
MGNILNSAGAEAELAGQIQSDLIVLCCIRISGWRSRYASRKNSGLRLQLVVGQCVQGGLLLSLGVGDDQQSSCASQAYAG